MLVADTLTADLTFYANGSVTTRLRPALQALRGVTEGDMTRYALATPRAAARRARGVLRPAGAATTDAPRRHARGGARDRPVAEAVLDSAAAARRVLGLMRAVVVALGKVGLPLAAQIAHRRPRGRRLRHRPARRRPRQRRRARPFPGEAGLAEALAEAVAAGRLRATTDTTAAVAEGPTSSSRCRR